MVRLNKAVHDEIALAAAETRHTVAETVANMNIREPPKLY
jgi:hypothetical protein